jgi:hypothetical protein
MSTPRYASLLGFGCAALMACRSTSTSVPADLVVAPASSSSDGDGAAPPGDSVQPASTQTSDDSDQADSTGGASAEFASCDANSDCKAVPTAGCCFNGRMTAVNATKIDAYKQANACGRPHPICPMMRIRDTRVARCNLAAHRCEMTTP